MYAIVRRQIAKWKEQQNGQLRELTEQKHFEVHVDLDSSDECAPFVVCRLCNQKCMLGSKSESVLISNWTRHVSKCVKRISLRENQRKISNFMVANESGSSSHTTSPSPSPQSSNQSLNLLPKHTSTPLSSPQASSAGTPLCDDETLGQPLAGISVYNPCPSQPVSQAPSLNGFDQLHSPPSDPGLKSPLSCSTMYVFSSASESVTRSEQTDFPLPCLNLSSYGTSPLSPVTFSNTSSTAVSLYTSVASGQAHFPPTCMSSSPNHPPLYRSDSQLLFSKPQLPLTCTSGQSIDSQHLEISPSTFTSSTETQSLPSNYPENVHSFQLAPPVLGQEGN